MRSMLVWPLRTDMCGEASSSCQHDVRLLLAHVQPPNDVVVCPLRAQSSIPGQRGQGELHLQLIYKAFEDDDDARSSSAGSAGSAADAEAFAFARADSAITDVRSAAGEPNLAACAVQGRQMAPLQ